MAVQKWWERTLLRAVFGSLLGRLCAIVFLGLALTHVLTLVWVLFERAQFGRKLMLDYIGQDVATSVAILDRVEAQERGDWLKRIERRDYRYILDATPATSGEQSKTAELVRQALAATIGEQRVAPQATVTRNEFGERIELGVRLADGGAVTLQLDRPGIRISLETALLLGVQLLVLGLVTWLAVRAVVRPLHVLAHAADQLDLSRPPPLLSEQGPSEVVRASRAFNTMRQRIADHMAQRLQILAAISHDLQTPITRMRLRAEMLESSTLRDKLHADLAELQALVEDGVAYARSAQASSEVPRPIDLNALLDSMVCDYVDAGHAVALQGTAPVPVTLRPLALKRLMTNLVDNAIKFAGQAEISMESTGADTLELRVMDRGPGIPAQELQAVLQPFYRVEASRNRDSGGAGLGLAIAHELATSLNAELTLCNRPGGGLMARVTLRL